MATLIDSLLDLAHLSQTELQRRPVDLTAIANRQAALLRAAEPGRDVTFTIEPGLSATGDETLLERAMANLLENAVKFTRNAAAARIEVGRTPAGQFFVRDNGAGFDMAHSKHLFGAFQRLHRASEFPGTGIGLAMVQRVILRHGGRIRGEARPGEGATFYFTLPAS